LDVLLSRLSKEINKVVDYKEIFIYLSKKKDLNVFYQVFPVGERLINKADSDLIKYLADKKKIANRAEIDYFFIDKMLITEMNDMGVDIALPIFYNKQLLGILMIDNDRRLLSIQQLDFLKELNKYLDIAVGSLLLYQQDLSSK
jgi:transcriptional regulator with GAF, ATPase, and Fis domain